MNLFNIMGLVSTVALALPIIALINLKTRLVPKFPGIIFLLSSCTKLYCIPAWIYRYSSDYRYYHGVIM